MINRNLVEQLLKEALLLQGQLIALKDEKESVVKKVEQAKIWLSKKPEYVKFLQHLQNILHQKNIGVFSELLSYFVKDVLKKDKDIFFELYTYHNLPALRIEALNNGNRENIIEGNGGSIANIVSTGLRLIALSRLTHRKFIVLDEPDCWLKPDHVPLFAKIIGEISSQLNIQTIIISHHHWQYFKDYGRVIELKKEGPHLITEIIHDTPDLVTEVQLKKRDVIDKIILSRFMSHYDTVFELHPHLTCLIGENDIGKSVLAAALKAVAYGDSSDSYIMHNENEAKVFIEMTGKRQVLWQRFLKTDHENSQKVKYSLFIDGIQQGHSEYNSSDAPEFIRKELNICTTEDIDVHIGNQKQPVFLLSNDTKPHQRAKILSLGKESLIIQKMMENIKTKDRQNKQTVKEGEERYASIEQQLGVLDNIDDVVKELETIKDELFIREKQQLLIQEMFELSSQLEEVEKIAQLDIVDDYYITSQSLHSTSEIEYFIKEYEISNNIANIDFVEQLPELPTLNPLVSLKETIQELELVEQLSLIEPIELSKETYELRSTLEIERAIEMITHWENLAAIDLIEEQVQHVQLKSSQELKDFIVQIEEQELLEADLLVKQENVKKWEIKLAQENKQLLEELGSVCPCCEQAVTEEHLKGILHA